jgi:hypothetical protein
MNDTNKPQKAENGKKVAVQKYATDTCNHSFKLVYTAPHGRWSAYKCEVCGLQKIFDTVS